MQKASSLRKTDHDLASSISLFLAKKNRHRKKPVLSWVFFSPPSSQAKSMIEIDFASESAMCVRGVQKRMPTDCEKGKRKADRKSIEFHSFKNLPLWAEEGKRKCVCVLTFWHMTPKERGRGGGIHEILNSAWDFPHFPFCSANRKICTIECIGKRTHKCTSRRKGLHIPYRKFSQMPIQHEEEKGDHCMSSDPPAKKVPAGSSSSSFR